MEMVKKKVKEKCGIKDKLVIFDGSQWKTSLPSLMEANKC
jgi:hypothetical protein